jgi:hypothetical protein
MTNALRVSLLFGVLVATVPLGGCTSSQMPQLPYAGAVGTAARHRSWIAPDTGGKNLLYVSYYSEVRVYDYGTDNQVGTLSYFTHAAGSCTDEKGNVYVTNYGAADIVEFAHGQSAPIKTLVDPSPYATDCAYDPSTGNLAVINQYGQSQSSPGNVAIYTGAKGNPKVFKVNGFVTYVSGSYDARGNLLVSDQESTGAKFAMLPHGGNKFNSVTLPLPRYANWTGPGFVRWDGEYFTVSYATGYTDSPTIFMWYTIKGAKGTPEGYMPTNKTGQRAEQYWLGRVGGPKVKRANQLVAATNSGYGGVFGWDYPRGGAYIFNLYNDQDATGVTASIVR